MNITSIVAGVVACAAFAVALVGITMKGDTAVGGVPGVAVFPQSVTTFTQGGGVLAFTATATQSVRSLTGEELALYNVVEINVTNSPALTLNLPASTSMPMIPNPGDLREWVIDNKQAAATTTTIVAGTGIDLIAVTANDDVIDGVEKARLTCWRKANTDVACIVSELLAAD